MLSSRWFNRLAVGQTPEAWTQSTQRPAWLTPWVSLAMVFHFALLPILWRETPGIPGILWTGATTLLLTWIAFIMRHYFVADRMTLISMLVFLGTYPLFCVLSYVAFGEYSAEREELLYRTAQLAYLSAVAFLLGIAVRTCRAYMAVGVVLAILAAYVFVRREYFTLEGMYEAGAAETIRPDYQALGDSFAIALLVMLPRIKRMPLKLLCAAIGVAVMFTIPSRSSALFGVVGVAATFALSGSLMPRVLLAAGLAAASYTYSTGILETVFRDTRFASVFARDTSEGDGSWEERRMIMERGNFILTEKPLTGEFGFQVGELGDAGYYMHNALDVWAQAGILAFLLFLSVWFFILRAMLRAAEREPRILAETIPVLAFAALSWALSRNIGFVNLFFCLGYCATAYGRVLLMRSSASVDPAEAAPTRA